MSDTPSSPAPKPPRREYPTALQPPVTLGNPNDPIPLYSGLIDFTQNGTPFQAEARICLEWLPSPRIQFEIPEMPTGNYAQLNDISLRLDDGTEVSHCSVTRATNAWDFPATRRL